MKRFVSLALALVLLLCGCGSTSGAERIITGAEMYSKKEINAAMDVVERYLGGGDSGMILLELIYEEEINIKYAEKEAEQWNADEAIVLVSTIRTTPDCLGSLDPDTVYNGYKWILIRSDGGNWGLQSGGYA